ncbi:MULTISPECIES: hypothetical protein [unclassified Aeromicrobium]|uniref:hypothetical protein n=1 Tax=unclassified Aeromicrobium TaxID=2633570 RepID=UPI00396AF412
MFVPFAVLVVWAVLEGRRLEWHELVLAFVVLQFAGFAAAAVVVLMNGFRHDVVYVISEKVIACEVNGQVGGSVHRAVVEH